MLLLRETRDAGTVRAGLADGTELLGADLVAHTLSLAGIVTGLFAIQAMGGTLPVAQARRDEFYPVVAQVAEIMPVSIDDMQARQWVDQLSGGDRKIKFAQAADFDLNALCCLIAIQGAAARSARWSDDDVLALYRQGREAHEHTTYRYK